MSASGERRREERGWSSRGGLAGSGGKSLLAVRSTACKKASGLISPFDEISKAIRSRRMDEAMPNPGHGNDRIDMH